MPLRKYKRRAYRKKRPTAKKNANAIAKMKNETEIKVSDRIEQTNTNIWKGQWVDDLRINQLGYDNVSQTLYCGQLTCCTQGVLPEQRIGRKITMKSLTIKTCLTADNPQGKEGPYPPVHFMLLLDSNPPPDGTPQTAEWEGGPHAILELNDTVAPAPDNLLSLSWRTRNTYGPSSRYKVLKTWKQQVAQATQYFPVPAITPAPLPATSGSVRSAYNDIQTSVGNLKEQSYKTTTVTSPYTFDYGDVPTTEVPINQSLILMAFSETKSLVYPNCQVYARFRFKDL